MEEAEEVEVLQQLLLEHNLLLLLLAQEAQVVAGQMALVAHQHQLAGLAEVQLMETQI
jgi:hypothetical protein